VGSVGGSRTGVTHRRVYRRSPPSLCMPMRSPRAQMRGIRWLRVQPRGNVRS